MKVHPKLKITGEHCLTHEQIIKSRTNSTQIVQYRYSSGFFVNFKRWYYIRTTISECHPTTSIYFKSSRSRKNEQSRHLAYYGTTIHPFSRLNLSWEYIMAWVYFYMFIIYFLSTLYISDRYEIFFYIRRTLGDVIYFVDLIHFFFEGYYDPSKRKTILDRRQITLHYLKTYFLLDLLAFLPNFSYLLYCLTNSTAVLYVRYFGLLRFLRLKRILRAFQLFQNSKDTKTYHVKSIKIILTYTSLVLFLYCVLFVIIYHVDKSTGVPVRTNPGLDFLSTTLILFVVTEGLKQVQNQYATIVVTFGLLCGFFIHLFLHAQILQVWDKFFSARSKNEDLMQQFKEYIHYRGLPQEITEKIMLYFKYKFQNKFYYDKHVNFLVSSTIKEKILSNIVHKYLVKAVILQQLPKIVLNKVVTKLRTEIFLPDDIIVVAGSPADSMFFIYYGTLAVYNENGNEMAHIEDGDCFGEMDMLFAKVRKHSIVAVTHCELFSLSKHDFFEALGKTSALKQTVLANAHERLLESSLLP